MTRTLPPIPELTVDISDVQTRVYVMVARAGDDPLEIVVADLEAGLTEAFRMIDAGEKNREAIEVWLMGCYFDEEDEGGDCVDRPFEYNVEDEEVLGMYFITEDGQIDVMDRTD